MDWMSLREQMRMALATASDCDESSADSASIECDRTAVLLGQATVV